MEEKPDYEDLVEGLGDMVYTLDLDGRFTYINSAGLSLLGYRANEILGRHFAGVLLHSPSVRARELAVEGRAADFIAGLEALYGVTPTVAQSSPAAPAAPAASA